MDYRREIDGLRALAVVPVILFHAGFQTFSGGFVGVDVFFVISGYLITTIILAQLEQGRFSLLDFYERRARRILPALFVVMLVSLPFAWLWLLPSEVRDFSRSLVAVSVFASNILFWQESGYFDWSAELKPLLHTWSLAVEEQYYVLFPLFLMLTGKLGRRWTLALLGAVFLASLGGAQWAAAAEPTAAFYLLPTRAWELLVGSFMAFHLSRQSIRSPGGARDELGSLIGTGLLLSAIFLFDEETPFPGFYALVPTVGTALIILHARPDTAIGRVLGSRIFVGLGLISYSAYLWHQPLFAFSRHAGLAEDSAFVMPALSVVSLALAYFSWKYVEAPFRDKKRMSRRAIFSAAIAGSALFAILGTAGYSFHEHYRSFRFADKSSTEQAVYTLVDGARSNLSYRRYLGRRYGDGKCRFNVERLTPAIEREIQVCRRLHGSGVAILGDSHAIDAFALAAQGSQQAFLIGVTQVGCRPHTPRADCPYDGFLSFIRRNPGVFKGVIYEQAGFYLLKQSNKKGSREMFFRIPSDATVAGLSIDEEHVAATRAYLAEVGRFTPVVWLGPRAEPHIDSDTILRRGCAYPFVLRPHQKELFLELDRYIRDRMPADSSVRFVSQQELFGFDFPRDFMSCDQLFWGDSDHLTLSGIEHFASRFDLTTLVGN